MLSRKQKKKDYSFILFTPALLFLRPGVASARVFEHGALRGIHSPGLAGAKP